MMMTALKALIRKDIVLFLRNRRALLMTLVMPLVLGAFFGSLFGGSGNSEKGKIAIAVVSQDSSEVAGKVVAGLKADSSLDVKDLPLDQAKEQVLKGKLSAAVVIPAGFGDAAGGALFSGRNKPSLPIYYDPSQTAVLGMVKGLLTQQVMQNVSAEMFGGSGGQKFVTKSIDDLEKLSDSDPSKKDLRELLQSVKKYQQNTGFGSSPAGDAAATGGNSKGRGEGRGLSMPFSTQDEALTSGPVKYNGYAHAFAGMAVQFILFFGIDIGIGILLAQRMGMWNRLLAAPISLRTILGARVLSAALIAMGLMAFIFLAARLMFNVQVAGSFLGFAGVVIAFSLVTASFGLLIAAFGKTPEAARSLAVFATLIMVMLGGAWVPSFIFPQWLQTVTLVVPTRWAVDGLDAMTWRGLGLEAALPAVGVQLAFAALFATLAMWRFSRDANR
jgi:ABC-2 type transport system permease protein